MIAFRGVAVFSFARNDLVRPASLTLANNKHVQSESIGRLRRVPYLTSSCPALLSRGTLRPRRDALNKHARAANKTAIGPCPGYILSSLLRCHKVVSVSLLTAGISATKGIVGI
eukprot:4955501-Pyramimonas_sp.AAC.1